jgi:hypothetical protein
MTRELPDWLATLLASPPPASQGVHAWLYRCARQLHSHYPAPEIIRLLADHAANCGRPVPHSEIEEAVANSLRCAWQPHGSNGGQTTPPARRWPGPDPGRIEVIAQTAGLADLWEASPMRTEDSEPHTEQIVDRLFPPGALLCCGTRETEFDTKPREDWRGELAALQFLVPSPMSAEWGQTKESKPSKHTLANTGTRHHLVIECDFSLFARDGQTETRYAPLLRRLAQGNGEDMPGTVADLCAAVVLHLTQYAPLVLAVHSGSKSIHAWFHCAGQPEATLARFFRYAVALGADPATWTKSQFVRMPDGKRDNGRRQTVFYFNPKAIR